MATFGKAPDQYPKKYVAPFRDALNKAIPDNQKVLTKLLDIANEIRRHRESRNAVVHEMATRTAQLSLATLYDQRERSTKKCQTTSCQASGPGIAGARSVGSAIQKMKRWYNNLVDASSLVFEFEYFTRPR